MFTRVLNLCILLIAFGCLSDSAWAQGESNLRKIFKTVPADYFSIACCDGDADAFIKKYVTIEDAANGYMAGADTEEDPQYSSFEMAIFKRSDGTYLVGFHSEALAWSDYYFLDYRNGKLKNISLNIPQYSQVNVYELPRKGTTIHVYRKKYDHPGRPLGIENTVSKGGKLYDLVWQNDKFVVKK